MICFCYNPDITVWLGVSFVIENIDKFYRLLEEDSEIAAKLREAEDFYPGSWEIRIPFLQSTLLAVAESVGLGFTIEELRKYETKKKVSSCSDKEDVSDGVPEAFVFRLLDQGWDNDPEIFKK